MRHARTLPRIALAAFALLAGGVGTNAVAQSAPRALVYCPIGIDTSGCDNIVAALGAAGTGFGGIDRGWDGTSGTVDLASADLTAYAVVVVPSLADGADGRPYDRLRAATVAGRLKAAIIGRQAIWSGTPDLGTAGATDKTTLLQSLAAWAASGSGTGLVALLDGSDSTAQRYDWVAGISALTVVADSTPGTYATVQPLTPAGAAITAPGGQALAYANMAAFGLHAGSGTTEDAADSATSMPILVSIAGASAAAPAPAPTGLRALVYCPVADAGGCDNIVAALTAAGTPFAGGADRGYDGASGTLDLRTADLSAYGVFVVPSLADGADGQPYAVLRDPAVATRLKAALLGPVAVWSGTPDLGDSSRAQKNILISNLAKWAAAAESSGLRGLVALQDASDSVPARYSWVSLISRVAVAADTTLDVYSNVQTLTPTAVTLLNNGSGLQLGYTNMASFGLLPGSGLGADAAGGRTSAIVLATSAAGGTGAGFPTVTTDREDYQPGDTITVTGAGWAPGETVSLLFHEEVSPPIHPDKTLTTVADANGHILNHQYEVETTDVGVRFALITTGQTSGRTAQTTFTDGNKLQFNTAPFSVGFNVCSPVITVQMLQGNTPNNGVPTPVTLSSSSAGGTFYNNVGCTTAVTSVTIPTSGSTVSFFYKDANTGSPVITAAAGTGCTGGNCAVTQTETITGPDLTIAKTHVGSFTVGVTASYTITVTNSGTGTTAGTVTVSDVQPAGLTFTGAVGTGWTCGGTTTITCTRSDALAAGASYAAITLNVTPTTAGSVTNVATVSGGGEVNTGNDTASDPTTVIAPVDLTVNKSHTGNFTVGVNGTYTLTVSNTGGTASSGTVTVTDVLSAGLGFVSGGGGGWTCGFASGTVTCTRGNAIGAGNSAPSFTIVVSVSAPALPSLTNTASVSGGGEPAANNGNNSDSDPTMVVTNVDLTIDKSHTGSFTEGVNGTYNLAVTNGGGTATTGTVTVTDVLPSGLGFVSAAGTDWTCGFATGTVTCTRTLSIGAGVSAPAITLTVSVAAAAVPSVTNTASVSGGGEPAGNNGNNSDSDPTTINAANQPPVANANGPYTGDEGSPVSFSSAGTSDPNGDVLTYLWEFGDGNTSTDANPTHAYADNGTFTVKLTVSDGPHATPATTSATIANVAPTATFNAPVSVNEGDAIALSLTAPVDVAADLPSLEYAFDCGSGDSPFSGTSSTSCPTSDNGTRTVKGKVRDKDGGVTEYSASVEIKNVAPTATFADDGPVNEASTFHLSLSSPVDPSPVDVAAGFSYAFDCGDGSGYGAPSVTNSAACPTTDNGTRSVKGKILDKDGGYTEYTGTATVLNVAPTVADIVTNSPLDEGSDITLSLSGVTDVSPADLAAGFTYAFDCGAGSGFGSYGSSNSASCPTTDNGTRTVRGKAKDKDGGESNIVTVSVTINNVAPTVANITTNSPVPEGSDIVLSLAGITDPSSADVAAGFTYAFDCGSGFGAFGPANTANCPTTDNGTRTVRGKAKDKDGGESNIVTASVTITNVAPTATFNAPTPVNEGDVIALSLTSPFDPSPVDVAAGFTYAFDCGTGSGYGAFGGASSASCPTTDNGTRTVKGEIRDKDGGYTEYTAVATINNVAPVLSAITGPVAPVNISSPVTVSASFTDPGTADTHTGVIDWGDGTTAASITESLGSGTASGSHLYSAAGVYTVSMTVTDDDGAASNTSIYQYVVVYDPSAGFVTGGGWISSPVGAYRPDPSLTGKANFGFVSKYQKGANVPTGNTEFQFQAGNLNFKSTSYEWLVISGAKGQYKGYGTINGSGNYRFVLTVEDGQVNGGNTAPDKFRIRIWSDGTDLGTSSGIVYDNQYGTDPLADATTVIGGGSIVVQSNKNTASK